MQNEMRILEKEDEDQIRIQINQVCSCGERFPDSVFQWRYRLHWLNHRVRKIGSVIGSALMVGMTFGSAGDVSRRFDTQ